MSVEIKSAVSVAEMARMVGLSRARFYQLIGTAFPYPVYDVSNRRPFFDELLQTTCLEVRRRNCGIDGKPILFYARRSQVTTTMPRKKSANVRRPNISPDLLEGLRSRGLIVSPAQVETAVKQLFPTGKIADPAEVIRAVFIHLKATAA
jgi:hypothetical protein